MRIAVVFLDYRPEPVTIIWTVASLVFQTCPQCMTCQTIMKIFDEQRGLLTGCMIDGPHNEAVEENGGQGLPFRLP